ncbi:hypothetical protein HY632_02410, partial [Candidatus Uhrbacteria bacterium]|nr:hypothetical protein [Candidatus Uhrbacteria bacterium]
REAALVAIDLWDDPALVEGLDPDREPKQWLADHMRQLREHHPRQAS